MKKPIFTTLLVCLPVASAMAQEPGDTVSLGGVVVEAARTVRRVDGQTLFPSDVQKANSFSGYSLLQKLALPGIRVDEGARTISSTTHKGRVQVRVNGIVANSHDLLAIDVKNITSIDFIDNPGVRYGQDVAYVINIHMRQPDVGYAVGAQTLNTLTSPSGSNSVFASANKGKGQLRVFYENGYYDKRGIRTDEEARYLLNDGSTHSIKREMQTNRVRNYTNSLELKYNLADSATYVFQVALSANLYNSPRTSSQRLVSETGKKAYLALASNKGRSATPTLDVYYSRQLGKHQSLAVDVVGTCINTLSSSYYDEGAPYAYSVDGKTYSLLGEAVYENRLKPFTLSAGLDANWKYMDNVYSGDANSRNGIHTAGFYAFTQLSGHLHALSYMAGMGVSNHHNRQGTDEYSYWLWRPKVQLSYPLPLGIRATYSFELSQHISQVAMLSDTRIRQNSMEWNVGNPNLRPSSRYEQTLALSYDRPRVSAQVTASYRMNRNCNMGKYERTDSNQFLYSQANQPHCNLLYVDGYARMDIIPDHLQVTLTAGLARFFNRGDDYNHCYTSYSVGGYVTGYWGKWTLQLSADNGWRFMEAEIKGYNAGTMMGAVGYRIGNCNITAYVHNPFNKNPLRNRSVTVNQFVSKAVLGHSTDAGNAVVLSVAWQLNGGHRYKDVEKKINNKEKETGILK